MRLVPVLLLFLAVTAASPARRGTFTLTSPDIHADRPIARAQVFNGMGCDGENVSPALLWRGGPHATKSYAVTIYDPDAPTGSGWWHWIVYDIPPGVSGLATGAGNVERDALPAGAKQGATDFGSRGYGGPCPPPGDKPHRFVFTVYALDTGHLDVPGNATAAMIGFNLHAHALGKATLTARYGRAK
jgi:Raf kinase inhibitor-like YbhB/YbcL family protein